MLCHRSQWRSTMDVDPDVSDVQAAIVLPRPCDRRRPVRDRRGRRTVPSAHRPRTRRWRPGASPIVGRAVRVAEVRRLALLGRLALGRSLALGGALLASLPGGCLTSCLLGCALLASSSGQPPCAWPEPSWRPSSWSPSSPPCAWPEPSSRPCASPAPSSSPPCASPEPSSWPCASPEPSWLPCASPEPSSWLPPCCALLCRRHCTTFLGVLGSGLRSRRCSLDRTPHSRWERCA